MQNHQITALFMLLMLSDLGEPGLHKGKDSHYASPCGHRSKKVDAISASFLSSLKV